MPLWSTMRRQPKTASSISRNRYGIVLGLSFSGELSLQFYRIVLALSFRGGLLV